jgi:signal transduction histidine kinase
MRRRAAPAAAPDHAPDEIAAIAERARSVSAPHPPARSRRALRFRGLAFRLYLPVTATVVAAGLAMALVGYLAHVARREGGDDALGVASDARLAQAAVAMLAELDAGPAARERLAAQLDRSTRLALTVYGADGERWATLGPWEAPPADAATLARLAAAPHARVEDASRTVVGARRPNGELAAYGVLSRSPHAGTTFRGRDGSWPGIGRPPYWIPPPLVWSTLGLLVALAFVSVLFVRSVATPLERLAEATRAFGAGDLSARAGLARRDEVGDLGRAFDEMADRITALVRAQTELLAGASHELRTPLARIRVALDIAADGDADAAREVLAEIAQDLAELEGLVADILVMARLDLERARLDGPRTPLRTEAVAVAALLGEATARHREVWPGRALDLVLPPGSPVVRAHRVLLRRAIDNLLDNAAKYSPLGEPIRCVAREQGDTVEIVVADRGIGIPPADLERLFTPFFRSDRSRTRGTGGVGLGLAIARRIVVAHGGTIAVESRPDEGTTFTVALPVAGREDAR